MPHLKHYSISTVVQTCVNIIGVALTIQVVFSLTVEMSDGLKQGN